MIPDDQTRPETPAGPAAPEQAAAPAVQGTPDPVTSTPPGPGTPDEPTDLTPDEAGAALGEDAPGTENPYTGTEPILQDGGE